MNKKSGSALRIVLEVLNLPGYQNLNGVEPSQRPSNMTLMSELAVVFILGWSCLCRECHLQNVWKYESKKQIAKMIAKGGGDRKA